jgi:ketosteroid isomerase-like protein
MANQPTIPQLIEQHLEAAMAGDEEAFTALIDDDFVQDWPQSGERVRGRLACLNVARNYPGGPPQVEIVRTTGEGDHWVVEAKSRYADETDYHVIAILEFRAGKAIREVDYFGPSYPAPEWRRQWVEPISD